MLFHQLTQAKAAVFKVCSRHTAVCIVSLSHNHLETADLPIKMRVFTANSEEARLLMECAQASTSLLCRAVPLQRYALIILTQMHAALPIQQQPFVILAPSLRLAALYALCIQIGVSSIKWTNFECRYDPNYLDVKEPAIADRLRKQAKTRAVKLVRDGVLESSASGLCNPDMLRGSCPSHLVLSQLFSVRFSAL